MNVLVITSMFPSRALPNHAVFVKNRILRASKQCSIKVVVPIPYFPCLNFLKRYSFRKQIPEYDIIDGMKVYYPRFLSIPKFLKPLDGFFLFLTCLIFIKRKLNDFDFELIDSHLAFPDGFGAVLLGNYLNKPVTITLRGHDINDLPRFPVRFRQLKYALKNADQIFSVAKALKDRAVSFGIDKKKIIVSSNGVDTSVFRAYDMYEMRKELNLPLDKKIIVSVGNLVERKGFHILIEALRILRDRYRNDAYLVIVGGPGEEGDYSEVLFRLIHELNLSKYVTMAGPQKNSDLYKWYNASDISCLASSKEGWANVLLESLACGKPVVATNVWGTPEVICSEKYGILTERNPKVMASALSKALDIKWDQDAIIAYAQQHTWDKVASGVINKWKSLI